MPFQFVSPKLVILFPVRVCSWFASTGICTNANLIVITPKEQTGAGSIVYLAGTVTGVVLLQNLVLKNQTLSKVMIT